MSDRRTIPYEPGLDGVRGVSILGVLLFHAFATSGHPGWFRGGNLGVSVFFTLSGFLITTLLVTERSATGRVSLAKFWARRVRRLVPASLVVVTLVVLLSRTSWFAAKPSDAIAAVWSFTNWHVIAGGGGKLLQTIVGPLGPTWSLAVEEQFYVVIAVAVVLTARLARRDRALAIVLGAVVAMSLVLSNVGSHWSPRLEFGTDVRAAEIAIGGLLALAVRHWPTMVSNARRLDVLGAGAGAALLVMFLVADYRPPWLLHGGFTLVALLSSALVVAVLAHGRVCRALSRAPLVRVGAVSYSLYLVHWPVFLVLSRDRLGFGGLAQVLVKLAVAAAVAVALHLVVEQPIRRTAVSPRVALAGWVGASAAVSALAWLLLG